MIDPSRREFVAAGGAIVTAWLGTDPMAFARAVRAARDAAEGGRLRYEVLTPEQAADLEAIAAQILPSDDLPGAREARVVVFIDRALGSFQAGQRQPIIDGLDDLARRARARWPGAGRFAGLPEDRQVMLLRDVEDTTFFGQVRGAVLTGMFAHPDWGGNYDGSGWKVLGFEPRYVWRPPFGDYDAEGGGR